MTTSEMLTILGHRLEDPNGDMFNSTLKLLMLNLAQDKLVQYLNPHLLQELQVVQTNASLSEDTNLKDGINKYFSISGFLTIPFGGLTSIFAIKDAVTDVFLHKTSFEMAQTDNVLSDTYYFLRNRVYCIPGKNNVDVYYIKMPTAMDAVTNTNSIINVLFHDALVELAEYECWITNRDFDKANESLSRAMAMINQHNSSIPALWMSDMQADVYYHARHLA